MPAAGGELDLVVLYLFLECWVGDAEDSRRLGMRLASLLQDLDRHDVLPCERGQGVASAVPVHGA